MAPAISPKSEPKDFKSAKVSISWPEIYEKINKKLVHMLFWISYFSRYKTISWKDTAH